MMFQEHARCYPRENPWQAVALQAALSLRMALRPTGEIHLRAGLTSDSGRSMAASGYRKQEIGNKLYLGAHRGLAPRTSCASLALRCAELLLLALSAGQIGAT
jgi:hypothetical protein